MRYNSVVALKEEILNEIDSKISSDTSGPSVEQIIGQAPGDRIAVGYSQIEANNFRLELRIQRKDQWAFSFAEAVVKRAKGEANFEIIPQIEIPTAIESKEQVPRSPIIETGGQLEIGISIGPRDSGVGTLGAFISRADGNYILSCNHVMVSTIGARITKSFTQGDSIYHPGREAGVRLDATREIAKLSNYVPLSRTEENDIDSAIAKLEDNWGHTVTQVPFGRHYPNEGRVITVMHKPDEQLQRDMVVCKIGRSTLYTRGLVRAVDIDRLPVRMYGQGNLLFSDVIEIRSIKKDEPFSVPGDSGSLVFTENGLEAIGLVFSGGWRNDSYKLTYVCKLNPILEWAEAQLLI